MIHINEKKAKILPLLIMGMLINLALTNCTSSDNDEVDFLMTDSLIIGVWELKTLSYNGDYSEIPSDMRDLFVFSPDGKMKVIKKRKSSHKNWPNEDGEYDYSYDKEKQTILFCGEIRKCMISDGMMQIEYDADAMPFRCDPLTGFIFIKKQN